jgi:hypothetical protein
MPRSSSTSKGDSEFWGWISTPAVQAAAAFKISSRSAGLLGGVAAREDARVFLRSGLNGAPVEAVIAVGGVAETASVEALDEAERSRVERFCLSHPNLDDLTVSDRASGGATW